MYHAVPKRLCKNKEDAGVFQQQWNWKVSPGEVMYGRSKDGRGYVQAAKQAGLAPKASFHRKSVFT